MKLGILKLVYFISMNKNDYVKKNYCETLLKKKKKVFPKTINVFFEKFSIFNNRQNLLEQQA